MRRWRSGGVLLLLLSATGCVRSAGAEMKDQVEVVKREQTWQKLYERGRAFAAVGDRTRAEQYFAAAIDAGGEAKKIMPHLLAVCVEEKKFRVAIDYGESHLKKFPDEAKLRHLVGTLYQALGDTDQARTSFEEVLRRSPDEAETHYALAVLYRDADRDLLRADQHFRTYLRLNPSGPHVQDARASLLKAVP